MPEGTKYSYKVPIDTTPGTKNVVVVVIYPDGSSDEVSVQLTVQLTVQSHAETYEPIGQNQTVKVGVEPDPRELIANSIDLPEGTKYSYKVPIDTTTPGIKNVVVVVTYPDGSSDEVSVQLTVQSHAETYESIGQNQTVKVGVKPDPRELIDNSISLPEGTKYSYKVPIDTTTPGIENVVVVVTYPDGSSNEVSVLLTVQSHAETVTPIGQNQTVKVGETLDVSNCIINFADLPDGTQAKFKTPVDTSAPGIKEATVVITYPDGSTAEVIVTIIVKANPTQAEMNIPNKPILKGEYSINNISNLSVQTTNLKGKSLDYKSLVDINQTTDLPSTGANKHNSNSIFRILSISTLVGLSMAKIRQNKAQF
ncbi:hypothetical protein Llac01_03410 [Leuconostoc lactis]|nr:hypothetical protein LLA04_13890 [Leuconostoc lactis]GLY44964.1 hypothetical protein Llac01_03410 [Leuconostoc lactis]